MSVLSCYSIVYTCKKVTLDWDAAVLQVMPLLIANLKKLAQLLDDVALFSVYKQIHVERGHRCCVMQSVWKILILSHVSIVFTFPLLLLYVFSTLNVILLFAWPLAPITFSFPIFPFLLLFSLLWNICCFPFLFHTLFQILNFTGSFHLLFSSLYHLSSVIWPFCQPSCFFLPHIPSFFHPTTFTFTPLQGMGSDDRWGTEYTDPPQWGSSSLALREWPDGDLLQGPFDCSLGHGLSYWHQPTSRPCGTPGCC